MSGSASELFEPGQAWQYRNRPGEEKSIVLVGKVEDEADGNQLIHIQIQGLSLKNPYYLTGTQSTLGHIALTAEALRRSVVRRAAGELNLPAFIEGYQTWQRAFESGEAQAFTESLAEILDYAERALGNAG